MLLLCEVYGKKDDKFAILDTDDMVIEEWDLVKLRYALEYCNLEIDNFDKRFTRIIDRKDVYLGTGYETGVFGSNICYGNTRCKFDNVRITANKDGIVADFKTNNSGFDLDGYVKVGRKLYKLRDSHEYVYVNGERATIAESGYLWYAGIFNGKFVIHFQYGVLWFTDKCCYHTERIDASNYYRVVSDGLGV